MAQQEKSLMWIRHAAELPTLLQHSQAFSAKLPIQSVPSKEVQGEEEVTLVARHSLGASTHWLCL